MDRAEPKFIRDFTDRILLFPDQLFAFLELHVEKIIFRGTVQVGFKQCLKRRSGNIELMADFFYSDGFGYPFVHIDQDLGQEIITGRAVVCKKSLMADRLIELHKQKEGFLKIADHQCACIIGIFKTLNQQFPEGLLKFAGAVESMFEDMESFSLIYVKHHCEIGTVRIHIDDSRIGPI